MSSLVVLDDSGLRSVLARLEDDMLTPLGITVTEINDTVGALGQRVEALEVAGQPAVEQLAQQLREEIGRVRIDIQSVASGLQGLSSEFQQSVAQMQSVVDNYVLESAISREALLAEIGELRAQLELHAATDATESVSGHVTVGAGLEVTDGVLRVKPAPTPPDEPPTEPTGSSKVDEAYFYNTSTNFPAYTREAALQRAKLIIGTQKEETELQAFKAAGHKGPLMQYVLLAEARGPLTAKYRYGSGGNGSSVAGSARRNTWFYEADDFAELNARDEFFLYNANGERLYYKSATDIADFHLDVAHPEVKALILARAKRYLEGDSVAPALGWDSLFLDNLEVTDYKAQHQLANSTGSVYRIVNGQLQPVPSGTYVSDAHFELLKALSDRFRPKFKLGANMIVSNVSGNASAWARYLPYLDVPMQEEGLGKTGREWLNIVKNIETFLADPSKTVLWVAQDDVNNTAPVANPYVTFAVASYHLLNPGGGRLVFRAKQNGDYGSDWRKYSIYDVDLGRPLGKYYAKASAAGVYRRDFANGYVEVDTNTLTGKLVTN